MSQLVNKGPADFICAWIKVAMQYTLVRYLLVGLTNTTVCFLVMYIGSLFGMHYLLYTAMGYFVAILYSFFMNLHFTFRVEGMILKRLLMFFVINLSNLGMVEIIEYILIDNLMWNRIFSILCAMSWYVITGFLINNYLVYRRKN